MSEEIMPDALRDLESALHATRPAPVAIRREQLLFNAGRAVEAASQRRTLRLWQGACTAALAAAVFLGVHAPAPSGPIAPAPQQASPIAATRAGEPEPSVAFIETMDRPPAVWNRSDNYLEMRRLVLAQGVQALREASPGSGSFNAPYLPDPEEIQCLPPLQRQAAAQGNRL